MCFAVAAPQLAKKYLLSSVEDRRWHIRDDTNDELAQIIAQLEAHRSLIAAAQVNGPRAVDAASKYCCVAR